MTLRIIDDWQQLQAMLKEGKTDFLLPFQAGPIHVEQILRLIPGKRVTVKGTWENQAVVVKIFLSRRAKEHARRETQGVERVKQSRILSPNLLRAGEMYQGKAHLIIFEYISPTISIEAIWQSGNEGLLKPVVMEMQAILLKLHRQGFCHADFHPNNFVLNASGLYLVDVSEVKALKRFFFSRSTVQNSLRNLATLYAQISIHYRQLIQELFGRYCQGREWVMTDGLLRRVGDALNQARKRRIHDTIQRSFRSCSDVVYYRSWGRRYACNKAYFKELAQAFFEQPKRCVQAGILIKNGNACTVTRWEGSISFLIKRYNVKSWFYGLKKCWYPSRAERSWRNARILKALGITTAKPVGFFEERFLGFLHGKSYFLYEFQPGETLKHYFENESDAEAKQTVAKKVVELLRDLGDARVVHGDLKYTNFIISQGMPAIVDLDSARICSSDGRAFRKARQKDLNRFLTNWDDGTFERNLFEGWIKDRGLRIED